MRGTKILRPPRHMLSTFGNTTLQYVLLSEIPDMENHCRRREGRVTAQRPQILTADLWRKRFEGFGEETDAFKEWMERLYGDAFRSLEYTFKNELDKTSLEKSPLRDVAERASQVLSQEDARTALLQGPDSAGSLSIMKFIVEMSLRSFPTNVRELNERGLFEPEKREETRQRQRVEALFQEARQNPAAIKKLGEFLKETGLFADYEDRFFAAVRES